MVVGNGVSNAGAVQPARGYTCDAAGPVGGISNLETIIAATIRAVTGQMGPMVGQTEASGAALRASSNMGQTAGYGPNMGLNVGSRWTGSTGLPTGSPGVSQTDSDPNTLYVGNVSIFGSTLFCVQMHLFFLNALSFLQLLLFGMHGKLLQVGCMS